MGQIVSDQRSQGDAGYFRIGNLVLSIPPEQIQCHKVINNQEVMPLRMPFSLQTKTGQSRWDVTWSWKAIADVENRDFSEWQNVRMLLAMFKAAPFVEVENDLIRQIVVPAALTPGGTDDDVMAFALRQLRIDTVPDLSDTLQITVTMSLFNFRPYSANFQYANEGGQPVHSAMNSQLFINYLNKWIKENLDVDPTQQPQNGQSVSTTDWKSQTPGSITLTAREYQAVPLPRTVVAPGGAGSPTPANPGANQPGSSTQGSQSGFVDNVYITPIDITNQQIQWWVAAAQAAEGAGYQVKNTYPDPTTGKTSSAYGILQWVKAAAIDAMRQSDASPLGTSYISTAQQQGWLVKTKKGYAWNNVTPSGSQLSADPTTNTYWNWMANPPVQGGSTTMQNNMATAWAYNLIKKYGGSALKAWQADRFGPGKLASNQADPTLDNRWFTTAVKTWRSLSGNQQAFTPAQNTTPAPATQPQTPIPTQTVSGNPTGPGNTIPITPKIQSLLNDNYTYDYWTEAAAFLYREHYITMVDNQHNDVADSSDIDIDPDFFVYPQQVSVVFMNNIAQLPLAGYQYPTYQHLGPVSTLVSIGMLSTARIDEATDDYDEPQHDGLGQISGMSDMLEQQFQRLRNEWRRVNSIHRMQVFAVKNQILNMLGIRGLMVKELTTETVPESANLVSAQLNSTQYEDIYSAEEPTPFKVTATPSSMGQQWYNLFSSGTLYSQFQNDKSVTTVTKLSYLMSNPTNPQTYDLLYDWLVNTSGEPTPPPSSAYMVTTPAPFTNIECDTIIHVLEQNSNDFSDSQLNAISDLNTVPVNSFKQVYPDIYTRIVGHGGKYYSDFLIALDWVMQYPGIPLAQSFLVIARGIQQRIDLAVNANPNVEQPIETLLDMYLDYAYANNVNNLHDQLVRIFNTPQIKSTFVTPDGTKTPGSIEANNDHGCYQDMGLNSITSGGRDYTPAIYFYDDNAALATSIKDGIQKATSATVDSTNQFARAVPQNQDPNNPPLQSFSTQSFQTNVQGILSTIKPSQYTMAKAFPTFKLFLMEDHADRPFFAYDNFYSYATVLDMEVIRYRDKPDTAIIQISNLMHLLDQHLYDSTPQGQFEESLVAPNEVNLNDTEALVGGSGAVAKQTVATNVAGDVVNLTNQFKEIGASNNQSDYKFPIKYFALQTGTKIQVRMGFSNNPDLLFPVFTGQVTEIEGTEMLTITAQSYMLELVTPTRDEIRSDGFAIDAFVNQEFNAFFKTFRDLGTHITRVPQDVLRAFKTEPAYGGWGTVTTPPIPGITTGGGSQDVISAMLKVSSAKHFGHWQPGAPTDPYLKGYYWQNAVASILLTAGASPLTLGATGLEAGYDRSFENILTTHVFGPDGTASATGQGCREWWYGKPDAWGGAPEYHVPKNPELTPWTLIQDIARRMPEFILAVKQYGFPYTADATLVYANPHDFYASRPPMPNEIEAQTNNPANAAQFPKWWFQGSASGRSQFIGFCKGMGSYWSNIVLAQYDKATGYTGDSAVSFWGKVGTALSALNTSPSTGTMAELTAEQLATKIDGGGSAVFNDIVQRFVNVIGSGGSQLASIGGNFGQGNRPPMSPIGAQQALQQIVQNYQNYLKQQSSEATSGTTLNDRMKPVRRYHFVNVDNLVHNGLALNEKYYNAVELAGTTIKANAAIPAQYMRVLHADGALVSIDNVKGMTEMTNAYCQSFIRDEVAKCYRGEIVLLGNPEIEPFDVLMILDPSTGISGPVEVDSVIHSFNTENGYITIVRPRGLVMMNDMLSAPVYTSVWKTLCDVQHVVEGFASKLPFSVNAPAAELAVGALAVAGGIAAGPWIAGLAYLGGISAVIWTAEGAQRINPIGIAPLTRYERPWIAGMEGYKIEDLMGFANTKWNYFYHQEIEPLIYSYRTARGMNLI